jgi:DNA-binding response OmpR family regulator
MAGKHTIQILYIEDDLEMIDLVSLIISRRGFQVTGLQIGQLDFDIIRLDPPDVFLLDLMMPEMDGWEVYHLLKSDQTLKNVPVVIITAKAQPIDRVLGLEFAHVDGFINKPFHPDELLSCLDAILAGK